MTELEKVWLAAIIDGEGSICIQRRQRKGNEGFDLGLYLDIANKSSALLNHAKKIMRTGKIYRSSRYNHIKRLRVTKRAEVYRILKEVLPYLIVKKRQAEIAIKFFELRFQKIPLDKPFHRKLKLDPITGKVLGTIPFGFSEEELRLYKELKRLNKRKSLKKIQKINGQT